MAFIPARYVLDGGATTRAMVVRRDVAGDLVIVDLRTPEGRAVVGRPDWFEAAYVEAWQGLVPECCSEGDEPGCWQRVKREE